jgi:hypothetical protein
MVSGLNINFERWITRMEVSLDKRNDIGVAALNRRSLMDSLDRYEKIRKNDQVTRIKAKKLIFQVSQRIIEKDRIILIKTLAKREGSKSRLRGIVAYANQLSNLMHPVLLRIDEGEYAKSVFEEFMPHLEEAARFSTRLSPEMAAQLLYLMYAAERAGLTVNPSMKEIFEETIQTHIIPKKLDVSRLLLELAERRFEAGEFLTSYLLARESTRTVLEDITGAYPADLSPGNTPSPDWIFEDYLGYLMEIGLVSVEQGKAFQELFVGEAEYINKRWKKRDETEKAIKEIKTYLAVIDPENSVKDEWL